MYNIRYLIINICFCVLFSCAPRKSIVERIDPPMDTIVPVRMNCKIVKRYLKKSMKVYCYAINTETKDTIQFVGDRVFSKRIKEGKTYSLTLISVEKFHVVAIQGGLFGNICIDCNTWREFLWGSAYRVYPPLYLLLENNGIIPEKESED